MDESYIIRHLTKKDGLLDNEPYAIHQDKNGLVWIATINGLQRFDGVHFKNFLFQNENNTSQPVTGIVCLEEDANGNFWLGRLRGIAIFNPRTEKFMNTREYTGDELNYNEIWAIKKDRKDNIWIGGDEGIYKYDWQTRILKLFEEITALKGGAKVEELIGDDIWGFIDNEGIWMYDARSDKLKISFQGSLLMFSDARFTKTRALTYDSSDSSLWISYGSIGQVEHISLKNGKSRIYSFHKELLVKEGQHSGGYPVGKIQVDEENRVWFPLASNYLVRLDKSSGQFEYFKSQQDDPFGFWGGETSERVIINLPMAIVNKKIWAVTGRGINIIRNEMNAVKHFPYEEKNLKLFGETIDAIQNIPNSSDIAVSGSTYGLIILDTHFRIKKMLGRVSSYGYRFPLISGNIIWKYNYVSSDYLFVDLKTQQAHYDDPFFHSITPANAVLGMLDSSGNYWIPNDKQLLYSYNPREKKLDSFSLNLSVNMLIRRAKYIHLPDNSYWYITRPGEIVRVDLQEKRIVNTYKTDFKNQHALWIQWAHRIRCLSENEIILQTNDAIDILDIKTNEIIHLSAFLDSKTPHYSSSCVFYGDYFWIYTKSEIFCVNKKNRTFRKLIQGKDFKWPNATASFETILTRDNQIVIPGLNGFIRFHPDHVFRKVKPGIVRISSINLDQRILRVDSVLSDQKISLKYRKFKTLHIQFSDLNYYDQEWISYEYALVHSEDTSWSRVDEGANLNFREMATGDYTLLLRAKNDEGDYSPEITSIRLEILPPFWQQTWFFILCGVLALAVILLLAQRRINLIRKKEREKTKTVKQMAELELQSLRAQLNPHFMFNSLNAIQELILKEDIDNSQIYLAKFAKLLRLLLENTEKQFIPLQSEFDFLKLYLSLENLRVPDLKYTIHIDPAIDMEKTVIPNMILQPYIENAIWHGLSHKQGEKILTITAGNHNGMMEYKIEDNGVGRKKAAELKSQYRKDHKSKGMELLSKRFELLTKEYGSEIETETVDVMHNGEAGGTLVAIQVPLVLSEEIKKTIS